MKYILVTGGCGFVGRNMVNRFLADNDIFLIIVDDLSSGKSPEDWLEYTSFEEEKNTMLYDDKVLFINDDIRNFCKGYTNYYELIKKKYKIILNIEDVFHFAAVVGGRITIENDPLAVAIDLSIDAEFFRWVSKIRPARVLYPSSSAAYPISLQKDINASGLKESDISFENFSKPDMTYGWSKLTGEYLAKITAEKYGVHIACVRPFSGYGSDQDFSYPIPSIAKRFVNRENPIEVWGDGQQVRDFIHINDLIEGMLIALDKISDGSAVNLGSGHPASFLDVINTLAEIAEYSPDVRPLIDKPIGVKCRYANVNYATELLKWEPKITLREGLEMVYTSM